MANLNVFKLHDQRTPDSLTAAHFRVLLHPLFYEFLTNSPIAIANTIVSSSLLVFISYALVFISYWIDPNESDINTHRRALAQIESNRYVAI